MAYRTTAARYLASYAVVNQPGWAEDWPGELTITGDRLYLRVFRQVFLCPPACMLVIYLLLKFFIRPGPSQSCPADRRTPARDVYSLTWISSTSPHSGFDRALVRRLAILKNWVDQHGLSSPPAAWRPVTGAIPYDPGRWQTTRRAADFDEDSIGILAVPPPSLDALGDQLRTHFGSPQRSPL
jgi:hypothetical protein